MRRRLLGREARVSERRLAGFVCRAALAVCEYQWRLFMAHEERAAGHADRAAAHVDAARAVVEALRRALRDLEPRTSANE